MGILMLSRIQLAVYAHVRVQDNGVKSELPAPTKAPLVGRSEGASGRDEFPINSRGHDFVIAIEEGDGSQISRGSDGTSFVVDKGPFGAKDQVLSIEPSQQLL